MTEFRKELVTLINRHAMENNSDTPDFVLADFLFSCLQAFDAGIKARENWCRGEGVIEGDCDSAIAIGD